MSQMIKWRWCRVPEATWCPENEHNCRITLSVYLHHLRPVHPLSWCCASSPVPHHHYRHRVLREIEKLWWRYIIQPSIYGCGYKILIQFRYQLSPSSSSFCRGCPQITKRVPPSFSDIVAVKGHKVTSTKFERRRQQLGCTFTWFCWLGCAGVDAGLINGFRFVEPWWHDNQKGLLLFAAA